MSVETAADRAALLADFGVAATYTPAGGDPVPVTVIFDAAYLRAGSANDDMVGVSESMPEAIGRSTDFDGVAQDDTLTLVGIDYIIREIEPDGTGMTILRLGT